MSLSPSKRSGLQRRLERLTDARRKADQDYFIAIAEALQDGASYADVAHMVGDKSASGIPAKAAKGRKLLESRRAGKPLAKAQPNG